MNQCQRQYRIAVVGVFLFAFTTAWADNRVPVGFQSCDLMNGRDLSMESKVIQAHPDVAKRQGIDLTIGLENGKTLKFTDTQESKEPGGTYQIHRVIGVGQNGEWVALFEPGSQSMDYKLVHRKSGKIDDLGGCPVWSPDGHYFMSLHEDLESGITQSQASLWSCSKPDQSCKQIWTQPVGGRAARWTGGKVEVLLAKLNPSTAEEMIKTTACAPQGLIPHCKDQGPWSVPKSASPK